MQDLTSNERHRPDSDLGILVRPVGLKSDWNFQEKFGNTYEHMSVGTYDLKDSGQGATGHCRQY